MQETFNDILSIDGVKGVMVLSFTGNGSYLRKGQNIYQKNGYRLFAHSRGFVCTDGHVAFEL